MLSGIDISYAQSTTPPLGAYAFVVVKATQANFVDSRWAQHAQAVRAAGKPLGAYCFGVSGTRAPAATQAALFLATAINADFLVLDLEQDTHWSSSMTQTEAKAFIAAVHAAGRKIGLYHSRSGFPLSLGQDWNWVADYTGTEPASMSWAFWQYADHQESGAALDLDKFNGDQAALDAFLRDNGADVKIATKLERWVLDGGSIRVTTLGAPIKSDSSIDFSQRLAQMPDGSLQLISRSRLSATPSYSADFDDSIQKAMLAYVMPASGFTQADVDAARVAGHDAGFSEAKTEAITLEQAHLAKVQAL